MDLKAFRENIMRGSADFPMTIYYHTVDRVSVGYHFHSECEIVFVKDGHFDMTIDGKVYKAGAGDVFFVNSGGLHSMNNNEGYTEFCSLVFDPSFVDFAALNPFQRDIIEPIKSGKLVFPLKIDQNEPCHIKIFNELCRIVECQGNEFSKAEQITAFYEIFLSLAKNNMLVLRDVEETKSAGDSAVKKVMRYINSHLSERITLSDLSKTAHMSEKYFCAFFKKQTGITPIEYVNRVRIERACELLKTGEMSVTNVALECGFESLSYFIRKFKAQMGTSPSDYKKQHIK